MVRHNASNNSTHPISAITKQPEVPQPVQTPDPPLISPQKDDPHSITLLDPAHSLARLALSDPELRRSYPQNMLVDIAQTCQDTFPFALVAKRHNQTTQKDFDVFSAVIQLPLLRSATDDQRYGELGAVRMKEFRAAKKIAVAQQKEKENADRKAAKKAAKEQLRTNVALQQPPNDGVQKVMKRTDPQGTGAVPVENPFVHNVQRETQARLQKGHLFPKLTSADYAIRGIASSLAPYPSGPPAVGVSMTEYLAATENNSERILPRCEPSWRPMSRQT
jgi:hypothetical protein